MVAAIRYMRLDVVIAGKLQAAGIRLVGYDTDNAAGVAARHAGRYQRPRLEPRPDIITTTRFVVCRQWFAVLRS